MQSLRLYNIESLISSTALDSYSQLVSRFKSILAKRTVKTSLSIEEQGRDLLAKSALLVKPKLIWCDTCGHREIKLTSMNLSDLQCGDCSSSRSWTFLQKKDL